jgi:peptide/nickel transport system permease protein
MATFLLRRLVYTVLLVLIATSVAYVLAATQLNPRARYEGRNPPPPPEVVDAVLDELNMNDKTPLLERFTRWAGGVIRGDLGRTVDNASVDEEIGRRMWVSLRPRPVQAERAKRRRRPAKTTSTRCRAIVYRMAAG